MTSRAPSERPDFLTSYPWVVVPLGRPTQAILSASVGGILSESAVFLSVSFRGTTSAHGLSNGRLYPPAPVGASESIQHTQESKNTSLALSNYTNVFPEKITNIFYDIFCSLVIISCILLKKHALFALYEFLIRTSGFTTNE